MHHKLGRHTAVAVAFGALIACSPSADLQPRDDLDGAIEHYVEGDYRSAIAGLEKVAASTTDEATLREAYTYLGRAHMALGETDDAVTSFTLGARYGDRGVCVAYLETLKQYVGGAPQSVHIREVMTRSQLAIAIVRLTEGAGANTSLDSKGPTPIRRLEAKRWMTPLADGSDHADDPVTRAALYVIVARMLAGVNLAGHADDVMPAGYRRIAADDRPVSGAEALAVLEKMRILREQHGR